MDAWNACPHGGSIRSDLHGVTVFKWMGDKPGLEPSFDRWIEENATSIPAAALMSGDWVVA